MDTSTRRRKRQPSALDAPAPSVDRYLTVRDLVERLQTSRTTIWRKVREGELPAPINLTPSTIRWRERDVCAWLDSLPPSAGGRRPDAALAANRRRVTDPADAASRG